MREPAAYFTWGGNGQQRERKNKEERTTGMEKRGRMGCSARVAGLAFAWCTDGLSIVTEVKTEYGSTDACRWDALVVGACGNSFLIASIFPEK